MKKIFIALFLIFLFIATSKKIFAVDITLSNLPSQIDLEPFSFVATISGAKNGINYLKVDLFKEGENKYFGETFNDSYWYAGSNYNEYKIATISGNYWTGEIFGRVGNIPINSGDYKIRLRRYTSSSNYDYSPAYDISIIIPTSTPTLTFTPTPTVNQPPILPPSTEENFLSPTPSIFLLQSYNNIFISEVMVNPLSGEKEWVELYNGNNFEVNLTNWFIDDIENGGSSPKSFSLTIPAYSYAFFELSTAIFNNSGDNVRLLDFNKDLKDDFEYLSSTPGKTYGRVSFNNDEFCLQEPSKGEKNNSCFNPYPTITTNPTVITPLVSLTLKPGITLPKNSTSSKTIPKNSNTLKKQKIINNNFLNKSTEEVLGENTNYNWQLNSPVNLSVKSLSFFSFGYSLLSFFGMFLKIKNK